MLSAYGLIEAFLFLFLLMCVYSGQKHADSAAKELRKIRELLEQKEGQ